MIHDLFELDDVSDFEEGKLALDMYIEDPKLEMENHPNLKVLQYWKNNIHHFDALAYMAMDITTVVSESSFNIGSYIINKYRSRFLPSNVHDLLCTRSWLYGYATSNEGMRVLFHSSHLVCIFIGIFLMNCR